MNIPSLDTIETALAQTAELYKLDHPGWLSGVNFYPGLHTGEKKLPCLVFACSKGTDPWPGSGIGEFEMQALLVCELDRGEAFSAGVGDVSRFLSNEMIVRDYLSESGVRLSAFLVESCGKLRDGGQNETVYQWELKVLASMDS